jgi:hypothetical protein
MAGAGKDDKGASKDASKSRKRFKFNPLLVVDIAGALGVLTFLVSAAVGDTAARVIEPVRDLSLLLIGCAVVVRGLEFVMRHRDGREGGRREVLRRLSLLDAALRNLFKSLSRDNAHDVRERRRELSEALALAKDLLSEEEGELAKACLAFCDRLEKDLATTVRDRNAITASVEQLKRDIERATRRGDIDPQDADHMLSTIGDSVRLLDDAMFPEWNADHYGQLTANARHFARELDNYKSSASGVIDELGARFFNQLRDHVDSKVAVMDLLAEWGETYKKLEALIAGLPPPEPKDPKEKKAEKKKTPRPSERFPTLVPPPGGPGGGVYHDENYGRRLIRRMPAAND